jgi:predicted hydrocarbon binding protein
MSESEKMVPREQAAEDVRRMAWRTALLHHYFCVTLEDELGEEKARAIIAEAIRRYGEHVGRTVGEGVAAMGLPNDPENFSKVPELPTVGWEMAVADTEKGPRVRVVRCPLAETWKELGSEELGRMYCYVDQHKYRAFNSQARLIHTCNVLDGDPYCEFDLEMEAAEEGKS